VDTWVWHQVGLELSDIDVEGTVESEGGGQGGDNLGNESVQVGVGWSLDVKVASADVVDGLVVEHNSDVGVLKEGVGGEHGVVWLNDGGADLWGWVDGESELGLLSVIDGETLKEEGSESRSGTTTDGVEDKESLKSGTVISELTYSVENEIDDFFTDGVVTTSEVVSGILFSSDELFWMEELSVSSGTDFINNSWLEIDEHATWYVLSGTSL